MSSIMAKQKIFEPKWHGNLSEYITAVTWSRNSLLAASSAAGEIVLWQDGFLTFLSTTGIESIDCLAFSNDGKFLAAGGQDGQVKIWETSSLDLIATLNNAPKWVDKLNWNPNCNQLAFSLGRYVQIWDAQTQNVVTTLAYEDSSILDIAWRPNGKDLAIAGNGGVKIWKTDYWDDDPYLLDVPSACIVTSWSPDSQYFASANLDNTTIVLEYGNPNPWAMRGFLGKISSLAWSTSLDEKPSILATANVDGIIIWKKDNQQDTWYAELLEFHKGKIQALAFQPNSLLLASAADDGCLCLWNKAKQIGQILEGAPGGFACLAWDITGTKLGAGGQNGELIIWSEFIR